MRAQSVTIFCAVFCVWPLIFYLIVTWFTRTGGRIDWKNIEWPWRKND